MATVKEHYKQCMDRYDNDIVNTDLASIDPEFQQKVTALLAELLKLWTHIEQAGVFSRNEELEDIPSQSLLLLTIPFLIADLQLRVVSKNIKRLDILRAGREFCQAFLKLMIDLKVQKEDEVERGCRYSHSAREQRIQLSRRQKDLSDKMNGLMSKLGYLGAKSKRLRELMEDVGAEESLAELTSEEEEALRQFNEARLEWTVGEAYQLMQITAQEVEMLAAMSDAEREAAANAYQEGIAAAQRGENPSGRQTYTLLPGGLVATNTSLRMQFRDEVFTDRNMPTMSLAEFADMEMAMMQRDMEMAADMKNKQEIEDAMLGAEGVEERERQKQADWDDWRDANPPIGITTKGNYS